MLGAIDLLSVDTAVLVGLLLCVGQIESHIICVARPWGKLERWAYRHRRVTIGEKTGTTQWVGSFVKTINVNSVSLPTVFFCSATGLAVVNFWTPMVLFLRGH